MKALAAVRRGEIGRVLWTRSREAHPGPHSDWFWDKSLSGGGAIIDLGCHCIEISRNFIGKDVKPLEVMCWADTQVHPIEAEDSAVGLVKYASGAVGQFEVSWNFRGGMDLRDEVSGTEGTITNNHWLRTGFEMFTTGASGGYVAEKAESDSGWLFPVGDEVVALGYVDMFSDMLNALDEGRKPVEDFYDGYVVNAVMDAAYRSVESKRWEAVELIDWRGSEQVTSSGGFKDFDEAHWLIKGREDAGRQDQTHPQGKTNRQGPSACRLGRIQMPGAETHVNLRGLTWDHPRGYAPLEAASNHYCERYGLDVRWDKRSLKDFGDTPVDTLAADYDLLIIDHPHVGIAAACACIVPLEEVLDEATLARLARESAGPSHRSYSYNGCQWALAVDAAVQVSAYRPDLFDLPFPQDWQEVLGVARALHDRDLSLAVPLGPTDAACSFMNPVRQLRSSARRGKKVHHRGASCGGADLSQRPRATGASSKFGLESRSDL